MLRPSVLPTTEERLIALLNEKESRPIKAKAEFISCLKAHKKSSQKNALGIPRACDDASVFYAFNSSISELKERTEAFNNGKCFCN